MKKNYFWYLMTFVMVAMLSFGFASCGDDDDEGGKSALVGTWIYDWSDDYYKGYDELTFKADGTGRYREYSIEGKKTYLEENVDFKWTFDEESMILRISFDSYGDRTVKVDLLTSKKLVIDGDEYVRK